MKTCQACTQMNPDEAQYCLRCGNPFAAAPSATPEADSRDAAFDADEQELWRQLIGPAKSIQFSFTQGWSWRPAADYYLAVFKRFMSPEGPRFALTWHWPAFLFDPFLWFLYRKMYMYALVYAIGPVVSAFLTGDLTVGIVWRIIAGASANYLYFWHLKDHLRKLRAQSGLDYTAKLQLLREEGGVQPYVLWLGVALHLLMLGIIVAAVEQPPPDDFPSPGSGPLF
ncbi:MAG: DUF2628 domain-containing protein [Nitrospirae bacterium]|nr:MAG: DUF2628 domain-containing protein [Nitrospirota bacterium]